MGHLLSHVHWQMQAISNLNPNPPPARSYALLVLPIQERPLVSKIFGPLRNLYMDRPGGYTRVLRIPNRKGDNDPMAIIELVDNRSNMIPG